MAFTGVGLGLRKPHMEQVAALPESPVPFWEIAPENVVGQGGPHHRRVLGILERDDVLTHGLSMSLGGFDAWAPEVLDRLVGFLEATGTPWHSEHLCWSSFGGAHTHELLPMPFTREAAHHAISRVKALQARLPVPFLLENISYYANLGEPEMSEREFLVDVLEGADCGWLLDLNNVYVNSVNHGFDPKAWLTGMPLHRVTQMHIAGHTWLPEEKVLLDTHGAPVVDPVKDLLAWILPRLGRPVPVLLERDHEIPDLAELLAERDSLQVIYDQALAGVAHA
ncbi:MAG TPA: DUF692 domain-containing protein [Holophagaceae bacterium]